MMLSFDIPGPPQPKERARSGRGGRFFTPSKTRLYERHARSCASAARMAQMPRWPLDARYRVHLEVSFPDRRRRDIDNVAKAVLDASNGILWGDDCQVDELVMRRAVDRSSPRVHVVVEVLG